VGIEPTTRLRILHTESSTGWGGQEIRILTEAKGFLERGHEVMLLTPETAQIHRAAKTMNIPVAGCPIERKNVGALIGLARWLAHHARDFDVINTHSSTDSWLAALSCAALPGTPPLVRTRHVSTAVNRGPATRWLYLRATRHIVTTGEALRQQLARDNGFPLEHTTSVRTGIDLERFRPLDRREARKKLGVAELPALGILATLRDWKGHDYLLQAFHSLRERFPDWQLLIIGDGPRRAHLEQRVVEMQIRERVRFVGNQDNVPEWLCALDLFVLPSYGDEGVPQSIMQAMACRLPVVTTPVGAIREAVLDAVTGLIVESKNAPALASGLARLMEDAGLRESMAQAGLDYARANFSIDSMLDRMETVFRKYGRRA
jgi:glycosyltransferase involved in cell wall biosynthesis